MNRKEVLPLLEELITKVKQEKEKSKNVVIAIEIEKLHHLINLIGSKVANKTLVKVAEILNNLHFACSIHILYSVSKKEFLHHSRNEPH